MADLTRKEKLQLYTVDQIDQQYRDGQITAGQRNKIIREKAHVTMESTLADKGFAQAIMFQTLKHIQEGWDNLKGAAVREQTGGVTENLKQAGYAMWGQVQILTSALNAIGEVSGQQAENWALRAGASPGVARVINFATQGAVNFAPVGKIAQLGVKSVQTVQNIGKAGRVAKAVQATAEAEQAAQTVTKVIAEGLQIEGATEAAKVIGGAGTTGSIIKDAANLVSGIPTVRDTFLADFTKFHTEMAGLTEPQTHAKTAALASKLNLSLEDLSTVVPGQALNEREMYAYLKALEPQVTQWRELAKTALASETEADAHTFAQFSSDLFSLLPKFRGSEVTAGRSVEILKTTPPAKQITDMLMGWAPEKIAEGDFVGAIHSMAEDVMAVTKPEQLTNVVVKTQGGLAEFRDKYWPMAREAYINLIFARPITVVRNNVGSAVAGGIDVLETTIGGIFGADKAKGLIPSEGLYKLKGMRLALGDGFKALADTYKTMSPEELGKLDYIPHRIPGLLGRIVNTPTDTIRGFDNFFSAIFENGSRYATAIREGVQSGRTGATLDQFVARRIANPTQAMQEEATALGDMLTFKDQLGTFGEQISKTMQHGPLVFYFPVMKTPIRLAKWAWNRTPGLQLISHSLYADIAQGGVAADKAIGRLTLSNLMGTFFYELAQEGLITGGGPVDPTLKRAWDAKFKPYSMLTPDGWVPFTDAEPSSTLPALVADFGSILNQLDQPTAEQGAMAITFGVMKNLTDKTYWKTLGDMIDMTSAISHGASPGEQSMKILRGPVVTTLTEGPLGAAVAVAHDPIRRETRGFLDELMQKSYGYSTELPPVRDAYGDPIVHPQAWTIGGPWVGIFEPLKLVPHETDRVKLEGARLEIKVPKFPDSIGGPTRDDFDIRAPQSGERLGTTLTSQERDRWQVINHDWLYHPTNGIEAQLLDNPLYQQATQPAQREMFMDFMAETRNTAKDQLTVENVDLGKRLLQSSANSVLPLLQGQDRTDAQQQIHEMTDLFTNMAPEMRQNLLRWGNIEPEETKNE